MTGLRAEGGIRSQKGRLIWFPGPQARCQGRDGERRWPRRMGIGALSCPTPPAISLESSPVSHIPASLPPPLPLAKLKGLIPRPTHPRPCPFPHSESCPLEPGWETPYKLTQGLK